MKKLITLLFLFVSSLALSAQENETEKVGIDFEAIKFMSIPMEGTFSDFKKELVKLKIDDV